MSGGSGEEKRDKDPGHMQVYARMCALQIQGHGVQRNDDM